MPICRPQEFVELVRPLVEGGDVSALAAAVGARWSSKDICPLLFDDEKETRQVASVVLGLVGDRGCVGCLARALHDPCPCVAEFAEHALWSVWFRLGAPCAAEAFSKGAGLLCADKPEQALACFKRAIAADSSFAEAYNQAAICMCMLGRYEQCLAFCDQAIERMPVHFGAVAGKGHALVHLQRVREGVQAYREAVQINPQMSAIKAAIKKYEC